MSIKIALILVVVALGLASLYVADKKNEIMLGDATRLIIGLSSLDSSGCKACSLDGEFYYNGCKHCFQDSMSIHTHSSDGQPYEISWGKNQGLYQGDNVCTGNKFFPTAKAKSGDTYWVEMIRNDQNFTITLYNDKEYLNKFDQASIELCSSPTNLRYLRISTEDGRPAVNGGRYIGYIDDIKIWNNTELKMGTISEITNPNLTIYSENFDECKTKTCNGWVLQNPNLLYVDIKNNNFHFDSSVTATNDNAHYDLGSPLSDKSWMMRFKLQLDLVEKYPDGPGFLPFSRIIRGLILGIPALVLPIFSYYMTKNMPSKLLGTLIAVTGGLIFVSMLYFSTQQDLVQIINSEVNMSKLKLAYMAFSVFIIIMGISKIIKSTKRNQAN